MLVRNRVTYLTTRKAFLALTDKRNLKSPIQINSTYVNAEALWTFVLPMRYEKYRKHLSAVQRREARRVTSSYRTASEPAVLVIAGVILVDLLAQGRNCVHQIEGTLSRFRGREVAKERAIAAWQR